MEFNNDNYGFYDENSAFEVSVRSIIGTREDQQDSAALDMKYDSGVVVLCDGMGGHSGGKLASTLAVRKTVEEFEKSSNIAIPDRLLKLLDSIDSDVYNLKDNDGTPLKAGTTYTAVYILKKTLFWASVGDSRIYIFRGGESACVTKDHNYKLKLDEQLAENKISLDDYRSKIADGQALISYIGIGGLELIDINRESFAVYKNDKILLMTDGLYKALNESTVSNIISNFKNISEATDALIKKAERAARNGFLDNTTIALIKIK